MKLLLYCFCILLIGTASADNTIGPAMGGDLWSGNSTKDNTTENLGDARINVGFFADNFDDGNEDWSGDFTITDGRANISDAWTNKYHAVSYDNYTLLGDINITSAWDYGWIGGQSTGLGWRGGMSSEAGSVTHARIYNGATGVANVNTGLGSSLNIARSIRVDMHYNSTAQNRTIDVWVEGTKYASENYTNPASYVGISCYGGSTDYMYFDNIRAMQISSGGTVYTSGNLTTYHDAGSGNETYELWFNFTSVLNHSDYYRDNATGSFVLLGAHQVGNKSYSLSAKYQDTEPRTILHGNTTHTPELLGITFKTQASGAAGAPSITSYAPLGTIWPEVQDLQLFNVTVNQSTQCRWYVNGSLAQTNATPSLTHAYTNTSLNGGGCNITAVCNNTNGSDTKTWLFEVGADSISYIVLQDTPTNQSMVFEVNIIRIGGNVTDWGRYQNHTFDGWNYTFRYANGTAIKSLTASSDNESLWFNGTALLPTGVYYIDATNDSVTFIDPTPANESTINVDHTTINASIKTSNLTSMIWNWNSTNTTFLNDSCVLHLSFDNNSAIGENSTVAVDVSQYGNNGTINGALPTVNGKCHGAFNFITGDNISCGNGSSFDITEEITISAWANCSFAGDIAQFVVDKDVYGIYVNSAVGKAMFWVKGSDGFEYGGSDAGLVTANTWAHIAFVYNGSAMKMYVDGIEKSQPTAQTYLNTSVESLTIGEDVTGTNRFDGTIDEVRIYNRALPPREIKQLHLSNLRKFNASQWYFETTQTDLPDGTHNYQVFANNASSEYREVTVETKNEIVLYANEYALINNFTSDQTFSQIAANISSDVCYSYYNSTSGLWEAYRSGYTYGATNIIPKNNSVFVFVNGQTTISATVNNGNTTLINDSWFYAYLTGSTTKTLAQIKTSMDGDGADVWAIYRFDNSTQSYATSGNVKPNEGIVVYVNNTVEWANS